MFRFRRCKKPPGTDGASGGWLIAQDAIYEDLQPHSGYPGREDRLPLVYPEYFHQEYSAAKHLIPICISFDTDKK